jgi:hypothetical protein
MRFCRYKPPTQALIFGGVKWEGGVTGNSLPETFKGMQPFGGTFSIYPEKPKTNP